MKVYLSFLTVAMFTSLVLCTKAIPAQVPGHEGHQHGDEQVTAKEKPTDTAAKAKEVIKEMEGNVCPVMGMPIDKKYNYTYRGTIYYFCCPSCVGEFKTAPEKYIKKVRGK